MDDTGLSWLLFSVEMGGTEIGRGRRGWRYGLPVHVSHPHSSSLLVPPHTSSGTVGEKGTTRP